MREIKRQVYQRRSELLMLLVCALGGFLFGEILLAVTTAIGEEELFDLGTLMSLVVPYAMMFFMGMFLLGTGFNEAISFGGIRKKFVPFYLLGTVLECFLTAVLSWLLHFIEMGIFRIFYPGIAADITFSEIFQLKYILLLAFGIAGVQAFFGALFVKYGKAAFWVMWGMYMIGMIGLPRLMDYMMEHVWLSDLYKYITFNGILGAIAAVAAVFMLTGYLMLRKQQVKI